MSVVNNDAFQNHWSVCRPKNEKGSRWKGPSTITQSHCNCVCWQNFLVQKNKDILYYPKIYIFHPPQILHI